MLWKAHITIKRAYNGKLHFHRINPSFIIEADNAIEAREEAESVIDYDRTDNEHYITELELIQGA